MIAQLASEVVVAVQELVAADPSVALATQLASALDVPSRVLHVEAGAEGIAAAIADELSPHSLLVMHSEHANRWSGKWSVAEHVIDQWGGLAIAVGPCYSGTVLAGPVMVAVDGSPNSLRSAGPARALGDALDRLIQFCRVVSVVDDSDHGPIGDLSPAESLLVVSNDPISALLSQADKEQASLIVLAARGNRSTARASISRTCAGVIAGATQPVMIVGTSWRPPSGGGDQ